MPDLTFAVRSAGPAAETLTPHIALAVEITNQPAAEEIQSIALSCQARIEAPRRAYTPEEEEKLQDVFGERGRWAQTLKPLHWANLAAHVPGFRGVTAITLLAPCTFDFHAAATKYFHALDEGEAPLTLLFSGTVFYRAGERLQAAPVSWNSEARFRLPSRTWKEAVDRHYGEAAWLCLRRDVFERLYSFKRREGIATFEEALEKLLPDLGKVTAR